MHRPNLAAASLLAAAFPLAVLSLSVACTPARVAHPRANTSASAQPLVFDFRGPDGAIVNNASTWGRSTALAFVSMQDLYSNVVLRELSSLVRTVTPRVNAAAISLDPPQFAELLDSYRATLNLPFPAVMADESTRQGSGALGTLRALPTVVVLDRYGREVQRLDVDALQAKELQRALESANSVP